MYRHGLLFGVDIFRGVGKKHQQRKELRKEKRTLGVFVMSIGGS